MQAPDIGCDEVTATPAVANRIRWAPDHQLVPAVLAGTRRKDVTAAKITMSQLDTPDRCWVVAGLTVAGLTADDIADRLDCSLRLVRSIRAEDMTQVCVVMQRETANFADELSLVKSELTAVTHKLVEASGELQRTQAQRDRLIDEKITGVKHCGKCGRAMDRGNCYIHTKTGKQYCRGCHTDRQQRYRNAKRCGPAQISVAELDEMVSLEIVLPVAVTRSGQSAPGTPEKFCGIGTE